MKVNTHSANGRKHRVFPRCGIRLNRDHELTVFDASLFSRRVFMYRRYGAGPRHVYCIAFGKMLFDWWPADSGGDRLRMVGWTILK